jgi:hypothetical protein
MLSPTNATTPTNQHCRVTRIPMPRTVRSLIQFLDVLPPIRLAKTRSQLSAIRHKAPQIINPIRLIVLCRLFNPSAVTNHNRLPPNRTIQHPHNIFTIIQRPLTKTRMWSLGFCLTLKARVPVVLWAPIRQPILTRTPARSLPKPTRTPSRTHTASRWLRARRIQGIGPTSRLTLLRQCYCRRIR